MNTTTPRSLYRPSHDRMLTGVASGLAGYAGIDVLIVRLGFSVLTFLGGAGIPLYLACWLLIPDERNGKSIAADVAADLRGKSESADQ
ncbi:MAG: PspC domain-containing protein [Actinobacteria bacterium]|nr:PspC domain-containing protein [Actinomycetota bacterium]